MPRIQRLDESTINKIAAGEIIAAPANALKELLENSIDAGSNDIQVLVKDGGCKLLHITDDGCGIDKEDLPILCERYTTSKITNFDDVRDVATYGFRGEALASISHVAHVTVVTKKSTDRVGWKARYFNGKMVGEITPTASNNGTQIIVEDLFFNVPTRLKALKNRSEEYARIVDVVGRYAIYASGIGFSVGRVGDARKSLIVAPSNSTVDRIQQVYGASIATHVIPLHANADPDIGVTECTGYVSTADLISKKSIYPLLFVNHRLVQNDRLRRALKLAYGPYLPTGSHYFAFISLVISPGNVDVNIHPTKREVTLLHEEEIADLLSAAVESSLAEVDKVRSFKVQTVIPSVVTIPKQSTASVPVRMHEPVSDSSDSSPPLPETPPRTPQIRQQSISIGSTISISSSSSSQGTPLATKRIYEHQLDRTDAKQPRISTLYASQAAASQVEAIESEDEAEYIPSSLSSIHEIKQQIERAADSALTQIFSNFVFVGIISFESRLMAIQHGVQLLIVDYGALCKEFFYQLALVGFSNFGTITMEENLSVRELITMAGSSPQEADIAIDHFRSMREMLDQYFSLTFVDNGPSDLLVASLPLLLKGYLPSFYKFPLFLRALGSQVDWQDETLCFQGIFEALALFHIPNFGESKLQSEENEALVQNLTDVILPEIKQRLIATTWLKDHVNEIANLPGLYRVFERC